MAKVSVINKKVKMDLIDLIKYQIFTYCYINRINVNNTDLTCLSLLANKQSIELTEFCTIVKEEGIFKSSQVVRNCIIKLEKLGLITKSKGGKKKISINPAIKVVANGNVLLDYKIYHFDTKES